MELNLKPSHKAVKAYYDVLGQYGQLNIDHEMAVRSAFQGLLRTCGNQFDWTLVPEYPIQRPPRIIKVDGALLDTFKLTHGFWEAKDEHDEDAYSSRKIDLHGASTQGCIEERQVYQRDASPFGNDEQSPRIRQSNHRAPTSLLSSAERNIWMEHSGEKPTRETRLLLPQGSCGSVC